MDNNHLMLKAAKHGDIDTVLMMIENSTSVTSTFSVDDWSRGLCNAALGGNINIMEIFIKLCERDYIECVEEGLSNALVCASQNGKFEAVNYLIEYISNKDEQFTTDDYNSAMIAASYGGHIEIINLMISKGANDYNYAMTAASYGGHIEIVKLMLEKGANDYNSAIIAAAKNGHINIIKLLPNTHINCNKVMEIVLNKSNDIISSMNKNLCTRNDIVEAVKNYKEIVIMMKNLGGKYINLANTYDVLTY